MPSKKRPAPKASGSARPSPAKQAALDRFREDPDGQLLTTDQGVRVNYDQNSLKASARGPSLLEDFILREKSAAARRESKRRRTWRARIR
jgi:catalase